MKCLSVGFDHVVLISERQELLDAALAQFDAIDSRAHFFLPEAFIAFLDALDSKPPEPTKSAKQESRGRSKSKPTSQADLSGKKQLSTHQAETYISVSKQTLANWRTSGKGPPFVRLGRSIYYELDVLDAWIANRRRNATSDPGADSGRGLGVPTQFKAFFSCLKPAARILRGS